MIERFDLEVYLVLHGMDLPRQSSFCSAEARGPNSQIKMDSSLPLPR